MIDLLLNWQISNLHPGYINNDDAKKRQGTVRRPIYRSEASVSIREMRTAVESRVEVGVLTKIERPLDLAEVLLRLYLSLSIQPFCLSIIVDDVLSKIDTTAVDGGGCWA